jgi:hypothetical protein
VKTGRGRKFKSFVARLAEGELSSDVGGMTGHLSANAIHNRYCHLSLDLQRNAVAKMPSLQ